jgi:hypothetical protein
VGLVMILVKGYVPDFPLDEEQLYPIVVILAGYILGTALEDGLSSR